MPEVKTNAVVSKNIAEGTASLSGTIVSEGDLPYTERGFVYSTVHNPTIDDTKIVASGSGLGDFNSKVSELEEGKIYYVRAFVTNSKGVTYGNEVTLDFQPIKPIVITNPISTKSIAQGTATISGSISNIGDPAYIKKGFVYAKTHYPTIDDATIIEVSGNGVGDFTYSLTELEIGSIYYVRSFATTKNETIYGSEVILDFNAILPEVETMSVSLTSKTKAYFIAQILTSGDPVYTERGFIYGTMQNPTIDDTSVSKVVASNTTSNQFEKEVVNINFAHGKYYVRAYAKSSAGVVYGKIITMQDPEYADYLALPTFIYSGRTYHVYPDMGALAYYTAISACEALTYAGYDDWYLPNESELNAMYINKIEIGGFSSSFYWSSTEHNKLSGRAWGQYFDDGLQDYDYTYDRNRVRCVRRD